MADRGDRMSREAGRIAREMWNQRPTVMELLVIAILTIAASLATDIPAWILATSVMLCGVSVTAWMASRALTRRGDGGTSDLIEGPSDAP
ncbi:hypothetical protein J5X84_02345 [Streptosporangiaceae bacterium NEAU-GS5]|nr:hypothetical protein [Streptosporangiaceae bacterium NEAU-GS5]